MLQYESEKLLGHQSGDEAVEMIDIERLRPRPRRFTTFLTWTWRLTICSLSLWAFANLSLNAWSFFRRDAHSPSQPTKVSCSCGNSVADALSMGCKYDALASAWLPPACIDADLSYEFDHAGPEPDGSWIYYTDYDKTGTYTLEEVSLLADTGAYYYNTMAWHLAHCTYNWRKAVRSKWTGVTLEYRSDTEEHVDHCEMMFKDRTPLDYVGTVSIVTTNADWQEMHKEMHPEAMHPDAMHPDTDKMHPESAMHPDMHPDNKMHPNMHPTTY
ncbi:hypothetical protein M409DRAFT_28171 [Zasmidium cellare ATCC 36951]|uniref:Uncharacterized protein n=1 Tax=Zasmidium cellare ATCC 36951 TaxID=1080233 RepID=A0A6A6C315_ZASCE|nr:uncharacterized protein M409DRAFT_28171 [Zasmidium cellare ATCC 36951]KAF2161441.1 hypothetical protein M409DRAFT_28171 [Zasmidium cellare ATCC 36951]